jgi:hypothetical protein
MPGKQCSQWRYPQILQLMREKSLVTMCSEKPLNFGDIAKGMFNDAICEFESYNPSHAVRSLPANV